ncbi:hypothetical protein ACFL27_27435 [candidate division CSSED10-310 bacterium]|uniref:Uncharacterized protein n=1 Tax=candidate division CSSED10-310 bacterium TaxID=2855610 RepID=A0ABV6Z681_UNCC1
MTRSFEVHKYSIDNLCRLLSRKSNSEEYAISQKPHLQYFESYFGALEAKTILVENTYIDKDYLEDYSAYYVRSFHDYSRKCFRFHFFNKRFTKKSFLKILERLNPDTVNIANLQCFYLGFIVVKPIPQTIIGRTCLKTYPPLDRRHFPIIRKYTANLFGINLDIDSIAYQEQDSIVAACATSALWSVFQGTGLLFQHGIPSPVEITKTAIQHLPFETRYFPNKGLFPEQMAAAIRKIGLEPYLVKIEDYFVLTSTIYAYLKQGIPHILGIKLYDITGNIEYLGRHAVAVTGYSLDRSKNPITNSQYPKLTSTWIDKLYVHDDQIGPFARMELDNDGTLNSDSLSTSWRDKAGGNTKVRAEPEILLFPLYHKIRIPFHLIYSIVLHLDQLTKSINNYLKVNTFSDIEWDIYLTTVEQEKNTFCYLALN